MANTFGILAALVLAFAAFVAFKNKEEHQTQIDATKTEQVKRERNTKTFNTLLDDTKGLEEDTVVTNEARDDFNAKLKLQNDENKAAEEAIMTKEAELKPRTSLTASVISRASLPKFRHSTQVLLRSKMKSKCSKRKIHSFAGLWHRPPSVQRRSPRFSVTAPRVVLFRLSRLRSPTFPMPSGL